MDVEPLIEAYLSVKAHGPAAGSQAAHERTLHAWLHRRRRNLENQQFAQGYADAAAGMKPSTDAYRDDVFPDLQVAYGRGYNARAGREVVPSSWIDVNGRAARQVAGTSGAPGVQRTPQVPVPKRRRRPYEMWGPKPNFSPGDEF